MNPDKQRIAIAEACGITHGEPHPIDAGWFDDTDGGWRELPDYLADLNAMHEAEKVLTYEQLDDYYFGLAKRMVRPFHATAAQRAEAFLCAIGKWEEAKP
jgi:hypothetical protein